MELRLAASYWLAGIVLVLLGRESLVLAVSAIGIATAAYVRAELRRERALASLAERWPADPPIARALPGRRRALRLPTIKHDDAPGIPPALDNFEER